MSDKLPAIIKKALDELADEYRSIWSHAAVSYSFDSESPIEWALALSLNLSADYMGVGLDGSASPEAALSADCPDGTFLFQQVNHLGKRLDFLAVMKAHGVKVVMAVECDGHDFHDRTKEQAARDRSRDRLFAQEGITTIRFTGSEIFKSPLKCAEEVWSILRMTWFDRFTEKSSK